MIISTDYMELYDRQNKILIGIHTKTDTVKKFKKLLVCLFVTKQ